jgi:hypothetical protein
MLGLIQPSLYCRLTSLLKIAVELRVNDVVISTIDSEAVWSKADLISLVAIANEKICCGCGLKTLLSHL